MGYQFNPITGKLDLVGSGGSATTDASLLTTGTLALARLDPLVSLDNINNNFTAGQSITAAANTSALTASYSVTGANTTPLLDLSGTWNTTGVARGILLNVTDTASAATSRLLDLQVGGTSRFSVSKSGALNFFTSLNNGTASITSPTGYQLSINALDLVLNASYALYTSSINAFAVLSIRSTLGPGTADVILARDAANTLALRNGTNAQTFRLYNTFTDASNFERGFMRWNSNTLEIGTEAGGTGAGRPIRLISSQPNPANTSFLECGFSGAPYLSFQSQTAPRILAHITGELVGRAAFGIDTSLNAYLSFGPGSVARDIFLMRNAATAFEVNNGTLGTFRDLKLRNVIQASGVTTTVTPPSNGDLVIEQTSNTSITFKMRGTDGTVRSASLTLS